jgi:hypothetical protein
MFDKLFNWGKKEETTETPITKPNISFGRYSDNNKTKAKTAKWTDADNQYKEKKHLQSIATFFDYLRDDANENVIYTPDGETGASFSIHQGSKIIRGAIKDDKLKAVINLAQMPQPGVAIMRRLLDQNFNLYYSRYALNTDVLCMRFDSDVDAASPSKLYYGLKELAVKADKQDDLLIQDFGQLKSIDTEHIKELPIAEKEIKYQYLMQWIGELLDMVATVDAEKFSGGISYLLLTLIYRIDFLILPEGKLLQDLEAVYSIYWKADERPYTEKNRDMMEGLKKIQTKTKEEVFPYLFASTFTFSKVAPTVYKNIADSVHKANDNAVWYKNNSYPLWHNKICEYGIGYCQFNYSLPKPLTDLYLLYMQVNYMEYFKALGFSLHFTNDAGLRKENIVKAIQETITQWKEKYSKLEFKTDNLNFSNLQEFNFSFCNEIEFLNFEL